MLKCDASRVGIRGFFMRCSSKSTLNPFHFNYQKEKEEGYSCHALEKTKRRVINDKIDATKRKLFDKSQVR